MQKADGYDATIVSGIATYRDGAATGRLPGRLVKGQRAGQLLEDVRGEVAGREPRVCAYDDVRRLKRSAPNSVGAPERLRLAYEVKLGREAGEQALDLLGEVTGDDRDALDSRVAELVQDADDHRAAVDRQYRLRVARGQRPEPAAFPRGHDDGFHAGKSHMWAQSTVRPPSAARPPTTTSAIRSALLPWSPSLLIAVVNTSATIRPRANWTIPVSRWTRVCPIPITP